MSFDRIVLGRIVLGEELMATVAALRRLVRRRLRATVDEPPLRGALAGLATADRQAIADALPALRTLLIVLDAEEER